MPQKGAKKLAYDRIWRAKNIEKGRISFKKHYSTNKNNLLLKQREKRSKWRLSNPEIIRNQNLRASQTLAGRYSSYKKNAKKRNILFLISKQEFSFWWQKDCTYCGGKIITVGLDRIDNTKGYYKENIRACCKICNRMKNNLTETQFIEHLKKILHLI